MTEYPCRRCGLPRVDPKQQCPICFAKAGVYMPTPAEIAAACQEIQATWNETTRLTRSHVKPMPVELPDVRRHKRGKRVNKEHWSDD